MEFTQTQPGSQDRKGIGEEEDPHTGDGMQWTLSRDLNSSISVNVSPHNPNYNEGASAFHWRQEAPFFYHNSSFINPQALITQTAPPFLAAQSHVSDHRQYYTDSQVNGVQTNYVIERDSVPDIARADQDTDDPKFVTVN